MSLHPCYPGLFVALFISSCVASASVSTVQHDEESRGGSDAVVIAAAVGAEPQCTDCVTQNAPAPAGVGSRGTECRVSADCVSDPQRPICDDARCIGCQNDAQCAAERPGMTKWTKSNT